MSSSTKRKERVLRKERNACLCTASLGEVGEVLHHLHPQQTEDTDQKQSRGSCGGHVPLTGKHHEKQDYELASTPFPLRSPPPRLSPFLYQLPSLDKLVFVHVRRIRWHELEVLQDLRPFLGPVLDTLEPPE